jgi:hypothetical protein
MKSGCRSLSVIIGTNNMKKCNHQRLLEKATPKIEDQKQLAVTIA